MFGYCIFNFANNFKARSFRELSAEKLGKSAKKRKTLKTSPYDDFEKILMEWFKQAQAAKIPINGSIVKEKALEIAERLKLQGFSASNGWIVRFKKGTIYVSSLSVGNLMVWMLQLSSNGKRTLRQIY